MCGNELFDMLALIAGTTNFFEKYYRDTRYFMDLIIRTYRHLGNCLTILPQKLWTEITFFKALISKQ